MKWLKFLNIVALGLFAVNLVLVFAYAPMEQVMGQVQRIFYFHVGAAWTGMAACFVTAVAGGAYLWKRDPRADAIAVASAEIGVVLAFITTATGSIWARPAWYTWWTWDVRLTTYTIVILIYVAYLFLRGAIDDPERRARFASVYGIVGFLSIPITFLSIRLWQSIHPAVVGTGSETAQGGFDMEGRMVTVLLVTQVTMAMVYLTLLADRYRIERLSQQVEQAKARALAADSDLGLSPAATHGD